jgi:hypothetical protein
VKRVRPLSLAAAGIAIPLGIAWAILPDAPRPSASQATPRAASAKPDDGGAGEEARRRRLAACLATLTALRDEMKTKCALSGSTCYVRESCEAQADGRLRCTAINAELTARYEQATRAGACS